MFKNRSLKRLLQALFEPNHWLTLIKVFILIDAPIEYLRRYIFSSGVYPWKLSIRTPVGWHTIELHRFEDIFTVNEIFIWEVYRASCPQVFIDIGGNVGFASLYFLTRCQGSRGVIVEPLPQNIIRAKKLLSCFASRLEFIHSAVSSEDGTLEIGVESTGRYSGIDCIDGDRQTFTAVSINTLLANVLGSSGTIDLVKIDCEGAEKEFMPIIKAQYLERISRFTIEAPPFKDFNLIDAGFVRSTTFNDGRGGGVFEYRRKQ